MKTVWTAHIKDPEEKIKYERSLRNSKWILDRQQEILEAIERGLNRQERSPKAYDSPNWEYRQAHSNGYQQCLYEIKDLINLDPKDSNDPQYS